MIKAKLGRQVPRREAKAKLPWAGRVEACMFIFHGGFCVHKSLYSPGPPPGSPSMDNGLCEAWEMSSADARNQRLSTEILIWEAGRECDFM